MLDVMLWVILGIVILLALVLISPYLYKFIGIELFTVDDLREVVDEWIDDKDFKNIGGDDIYELVELIIKDIKENIMEQTGFKIK